MHFSLISINFGVYICPVLGNSVASRLIKRSSLFLVEAVPVRERGCRSKTRWQCSLRGLHQGPAGRDRRLVQLQVPHPAIGGREVRGRGGLRGLERNDRHGPR